MSMNERLTRLKERRVYFGSRLEGLGHYDREGRRSLRWPVGHLSQKAKGHQCWHSSGFLISYFLLSLGAQLMVGCLQGYRFRVGRFFLSNICGAALIGSPETVAAKLTMQISHHKSVCCTSHSNT